MAVVTVPYTFTNGATIYAAEHNSNFSTLYNEFNGNIDNANIKSTAAIVDTKLNQITTAGKVSGAALTLLASTPTSAGYLPIACGGLGTGMAGVTSGSMLYFSSVGTISAFASGTSGQFLMSTGASSVPIYKTITTGLGISSYDSGWITLAHATTAVLTHNLGTTKVQPTIFISGNTDGSGTCALAAETNFHDGAAVNGVNMIALSTATIIIQGGDTVLAALSSGNIVDGYVRVIISSLA